MKIAAKYLNNPHLLQTHLRELIVRAESQEEGRDPMYNQYARGKAQGLNDALKILSGDEAFKDIRDASYPEKKP